VNIINKVIDSFNKHVNFGESEKIITKGITVSLTGILLANLSSFAFLFCKTRLMPARDVGLLVLATSITLTAFIIANGFSGAVFRYASLYRGEEKPEKIKGVVFITYKFAVPLFLLILVLISGFAGYIAVDIFGKEQLIPLIRIISLATFFGAISNINSSLLRSKYLVQYRYTFDVLRHVLSVVIILAVLLVRRYELLIIFAAAWTLANFFSMIYSFFIVRREFPFVFQREVKAKEERKRFFRYAFVVQLSEMLLRFRKEINVFIIAFFLPASDIALYNVALRIGFATGMLAQGLNEIFPAFAAVLYGKGEIGEIRRMHKKSAVTLSLMSITVFLLFVLFGKYILGLFGSFYKNAWVPLLIIAFSFVIESVVASAGQILNVLGKPHFNIVNILIAISIIILLSCLLIPKLGVVGAAIAFSASFIVQRFMALGQVVWVYSIKEKNKVKFFGI